MSESDNSKRACFAISKPVLAAGFIGILILGACIPSTVNHVAAVSPVSVVNSTSEHLSLNGRVESDEIKLAMVMPGTVAEVAVREGQHVSKGQVLVRLSSADAEIENSLKAIDQVISATEKMKARAELWLAEVKRSTSSSAPKAANGSEKSERSKRKSAYKNAASKSLAETDSNANNLSISQHTVNGKKNDSTDSLGDASVDKSSIANLDSTSNPAVTGADGNSNSNSNSSLPFRSDPADQSKTIALDKLLRQNENETSAKDPSSAVLTSNADSTSSASSPAKNAVTDAMSVAPTQGLSKKELKAKYKEQLAKIDKNEKERRKNLKMGYALVQALADSKEKGSKSVLASEDLKAAGFTDILKGEILRSGMVDPSQLFPAQLANLNSSGVNAALLKDPKMQDELAKLAKKQAGASGHLDPKLLAANLSKVDSESLSQLLKSNAISIDESGVKQRNKKNELHSLDAITAGSKPSTLQSVPFDRARVQALLNSNQLSARQNSKPDFEAMLRNASNIGGAKKLSTLQIETEIAKADAEIAKAKALKQELLSKRSASVLTSPVDGIISARNINPGEIVLPGRILIRISAPDRFYVRAFIPEGQLSKIKMGQKATVFLDGEKDRPLTATVSAIDSEPSFTPENVYFKEDRVRQVFGIKLRIDNSNGAAKSGMPADAIVFLFEPKA